LQEPITLHDRMYRDIKVRHTVSLSFTVIEIRKRLGFEWKVEDRAVGSVNATASS